MSAWLCENKTLSLVVDIIKSNEFQAYDKECYGLKDTFELMCLLSNLNTKSLDCRYGYSEDNILKNIYKRDIEPIAKQFLNDFFENVNCTNIFNNNWWNWLDDYPIIEIPFTEDYIKYREDNGYLRYDF